MPIGDVLDLHTFRPKDVPSLIPDYLEECQELGYESVRIIHGKGKGVLLRTVHSILSKHEAVESFELADITAGGWGATLVRLRKAK